MITEISRRLTGIYCSSNTSVLFQSNPYLSVNNEVILFFDNNDTKYSGEVFSSNANTVVVSVNIPDQNNKPVVLRTPHFANVAGVSETFSSGYGQPVSVLYQAWSNGGSSNVSIEVSTNGSNWVTANTMRLTEATGNTNYTVISTPWPYARLNVLDIPAGKWIRVNKVI